MTLLNMHVSFVTGMAETANHWIKKDWLMRTEQKIREQNVIAVQLVLHDKIMFLPLHIKLGVKYFVKR